MHCFYSTICIYTNRLLRHAQSPEATPWWQLSSYSALLKLQQLDQGKSVHIIWMMCHGVKDSLRLAQVCIIHTSISHIKKQARKASFRVQRQVWVQAGSPSTVWYKAVTDYQPIIISRSMKRRDATTYTRFRLGSRCYWEIEKRVPRDCQHCQTIFDKPLLHYILPCSLLEQTKTTALLYICLTKSSWSSLSCSVSEDLM